MLKIPDIAAHLREYKHSKKQSAETLLSQIGEFHLQANPYKLPYDSQTNTPLSWWRMYRTTDEICATLNNARRHIEEYEIEEYDEKQMEEMIMARSSDDDDEQIPLQELEISKVLDLELMFGNKLAMNKQLEIDDELNKFIQELDKEEDFDPDSLVQNFVNN
ncbi:uncharacterized protein OCT59_004865 [Rhizophagus irregularis]|uniref:uncharacterized protein n=1 Tax=Rhizophagus irregularis TaxID=588596 RepID=UPI003331F392|nr:hypothetical protein OCT59_004865 [Rhizophagus irregularis]